MSTKKVAAVYRVDSRFTFADVMAKKMESIGLSKAELARRSGVSEGVLTYMLKAGGYASWDKFLAVCSVLYINPGKVMEGDYLVTNVRDRAEKAQGGFQ